MTPHKRFSKMIFLNAKNSESALLAEPHGAVVFSCRTLTFSTKVSCRTPKVAEPKTLTLEKDNLAEPWNEGSFRKCPNSFPGPPTLPFLGGVPCFFHFPIFLTFLVRFAFLSPKESPCLFWWVSLAFSKKARVGGSGALFYACFKGYLGWGSLKITSKKKRKPQRQTKKNSNDSFPKDPAVLKRVRVVNCYTQTIFYGYF